MRTILPIALAVTAAGCTNDQPVEARAADGTLEFVTAGGPAEAACVGSLRIGPARQEPAWEIEALGPQGEQIACAARLPLRYGITPPGFRTLVPARPLAPGTTYALTGSGKRFLRSAFRYPGPGRPVENFKPHSPEWCAAQYPGSQPDWLGQCRIR